MRVPYLSGKEGGERHHRLQQLLAPQPALGHLAAGTSETLFLTYFRRRLGAINNQQRRRKLPGHKLLPAATSRPPAGGSSGKRPLPRGRAPCPAAEPPAPPRLAAHPAGLRKGSPSFPAGLRGGGGQTDTNKSPACHARGPGARPSTEGCPPAPALREGTDAVPPLCPATLRPLAAPRHRPGTQRSGRRCPPIARAPRGVQAAAAPGWRSAGIRRQRLLLPRRPVPPAPALAGRGGGALGAGRAPLPAARRRGAAGAGAAAGGAAPAAKQRPLVAPASSALAPGFPCRLTAAPRSLRCGSLGGRCWQGEPRCPRDAPAPRSCSPCRPAGPGRGSGPSRGYAGPAWGGPEGPGDPRGGRDVSLALTAFQPRPAPQRPLGGARCGAGQACPLPRPPALPARCPLSGLGTVRGAARGEKAPGVVGGSGGAGRAEGHLPGVQRWR